MLFPYTVVPHQMDKMQSFIDFIFHEVWCKAPTSGPFGLHLFSANAELHDLMQALFYRDSEGADFFYSHVERIHGLFAALRPADIQQFQRWYKGNNDLEKVCANDSAVELARYVDIAVHYKPLSEQLKTFFKGLYSQALLDLAAMRERIGDIDSHYKAFTSTNRSGKCPFCGIGDLLGKYNTRRDAYDHYLPKVIYPFNSINFKNLVPACHHCNSSYKGSKNPAYMPKDPAFGAARRKVFYPFSATPFGVEVQVTLAHADIDRLTPADIGLTFGPASIAEELETWKDVYGIEERYRGKLLDGDAKSWVIRVMDEWRWHDQSAGAEGRTPADYLRDEARHANRRPYADLNFLRIGFLNACKNVGLFGPAIVA